MTLSYNRYAYVLNNPLVLTDPSGYSWLSKKWHSLWHNQFFRTALAIGVAWWTGGLASQAYIDASLESLQMGIMPSAIGGNVGLTANIIQGAVGGFAGTLVSTGGDVKAAAQGALSGGMFGGVGFKFDGGEFTNYAGHAAAGCIGAVAQGGNCGRGAASQVFSKFVTVQTRGMDLDRVSRGVIASVAGGAASAISGGKFRDGAFTAAMGYLFNECGATHACGSDSTSVRVTGNRVVGDLAHVEIEISSGYDFTVLEARPGSNGRLVDTSNGPNWGSAFSYEVLPPAGETTASVGLKLQTAASLYKNDLWYGIPSPLSSFGRVMDYGYNSNSYVGGLIDYALPGLGIRWGIQATARASGYRIPGMEKPIPLGSP
jgi:hypothetical protein